MQSTIIGTLLLTAALSVLADTPTPYWHQHFSVDFNETTKAVFWQWQTEGTWYYNAKTNQEHVYRANGRGDRYCAFAFTPISDQAQNKASLEALWFRFCKSIHPFSDTPCSHLITGGNRYLIFPDLGTCCFCCNAEHGCGILDPHWLDDAEYQGLVPVAGTEAYKWSKKGLQPNYYYSTPDVVQVSTHWLGWETVFCYSPVQQCFSKFSCNCRRHVVLTYPKEVLLGSEHLHPVLPTYRLVGIWYTGMFTFTDIKRAHAAD
jgi:hypothetical protein